MLYGPALTPCFGQPPALCYLSSPHSGEASGVLRVLLLLFLPSSTRLKLKKFVRAYSPLTDRVSRLLR